MIAAFGKLCGFARFGVDGPDVPLFLRQIPHAVGFVSDAGNVASHHAQLFLLLIFVTFNRLFILLAELGDKAAAIGRPGEAGKAAGETGERASFAAKGGNKVKLELVFVASVGKKGDVAAVGRPLRGAVYMVAVGELAGRSTAIAGNEPKIGVFFFGFAIHALDGEDDVAAVRGYLRGRDLLGVVEVFGGDETFFLRHGFSLLSRRARFSSLARLLVGRIIARVWEWNQTCKAFEAALRC